MSSESNNHQTVKKGTKPKRTISKTKQELAEVRDALREKEKELLDCRRTLDDVREELQNLKSTGAEAILDREASLLKGSAKASYWMGLYPHEGRYLVKIEHLLTHENKTLPFDANAIIEFISSYLPRPDETLKSDTSTTKSTERRQRRPSGVLRVVSKEEGKASRVLRQEEPFEVSLTLDLGGAASTAEEPMRHAVTIFAKPLLGGPKKVLGETRGILTSTEPPAIRVFAKAPPKGAYRLWAEAILQGSGWRQISTASVVEGNVVQVF